MGHTSSHAAQRHEILCQNGKLVELARRDRRLTQSHSVEEAEARHRDKGPVSSRESP